jgi:holo-[acyl-carrier protein] synthase
MDLEGTGGLEEEREGRTSMIRGLGVDLVSVKRMEEAVARHGEKLLNRVFTPREIEYCMSKGFPAQHLAGRWAIKEAFFKAMGIGWGQGLRWKDVGLEGETGAVARVVLRGEMKKRAENGGIRQVWASLSHEKDFAVATVLLSDSKEDENPSLEGANLA